MSTDAQLTILARGVGEWVIRSLAFHQLPQIETIEFAARQQFFGQFETPQELESWLNQSLMTYSGGLVSAKLLRAIQDGIVFEVTGNGATTSYIYYLRHFSFGEAA